MTLALADHAGQSSSTLLAAASRNQIFFILSICYQSPSGGFLRSRACRGSPQSDLEGVANWIREQDSQIRPVTRICESPRKARLRTIAALRGEVCSADKAAICCGHKSPDDAAASSVVESGKWTFALSASDDLRCHLFDFGMNNDSLLLHPIFAQMCRAYIIKGRNAKLPQGADQFQM